ncbi:helix-turn-helix transcriptional regulator [Alteriqipengyuania flavescens]|uniref:helix-turn-helix transcriptional regulator n=1 Tax=Alteriqipengyuania flavescens TaxID=3053610 RepID=UPI0025B547BE|nr:helix-turn-helix transcriptional regulator [Alteriqipengyuania flavescens]WJY19438.1 helix-turn-helix transcriptional regulator [Alteriqipengyuania flavescens]WJY25380.1 helix-turn-helix transcriptional regulator [Alteriqipengyuania flavescens]
MPPDLENEVRCYREARGWTQAQLAEAMGVSRKTVNTVENGVFNPSVVVALKFSAALGQPVETLFRLTGTD